jgi:septum formation protein
MSESRIILASSSPRRSEILKKIGFAPDLTCPADIDETPYKQEKPKALAERLAQQKAAVVAVQYPDDIVVAGDTLVYCRRQYLHKPQDINEERKFLEMLSGRRHKVYSGVAVMHRGKVKVRVVESVVKFKRLSADEIELYLSLEDQWQGRSGGYSLQGFAGCFIEWIQGSDSSIIGLPMHETYKLITSFGSKPKL